MRAAWHRCGFMVLLLLTLTPAGAKDAHQVADDAVQDGEEVPPPLVILTSPPDGEAGTTPEEPSWNRSASAWYAEGVSAYLEERWDVCVRYLENALTEWHFFKRAHIRCRRECADEARSAPRLFPEDIDNMYFGEEMVRKTLCLIKCKRNEFARRRTPELMSNEQQAIFRSLRPYEYLQLCFFQKKDFQRAASAVFTFLSHHPDNEMMKNNFRFYVSMPEVDVNLLQNFEAEGYVGLFARGTDAYFHENYALAIRELEQSLKEYLKAEDDCRADCEGSFDQGWFPDYTSSIANHFAFCLKCKAKCHLVVPHVNSNPDEDFVSTHYNYLQFAYYKEGKFKEAIRAAFSYLLFAPKDEVMLENVEYYRSLPGVTEDMFKARPEAIFYAKRHLYETELLGYVSDEFVFDEKQEEQVQNATDNEIYSTFTSKKSHLRVIEQQKKDSLESLGRYTSEIVGFSFEPESTKVDRELFSTSNELDPKERVKRPVRNERSVLSVKETELKMESAVYIHFKERHIFNLKKEEELSGQKRFSLDGLASEDECRDMVNFARFAGVMNDGYEGSKSPHSPSEKFEGVSLGRAALMVHFGVVELEMFNLFLNLSERGRNITADYFEIPRNKLYHAYTHLVCRSALQGQSSNTSHFSHQIHADNCLLQRDGRCIRGDPAYYWRDYSAILYLNDDFQGGEFIFSKDPLGKQVQSLVKPTCGRLVGFSSGSENLHGVRSVQRGQRCALGLWFTLDPHQTEWGRTLIEQMNGESKIFGSPSKHTLEQLIDLVHFDMKDTKTKMHEYQGKKMS